MLGNNKDKWKSLCHVSDALKVFQKNYTFVQELKLTSEGVVFRLNLRSDGKNISIRIDVWNSAGVKVVNFFNDDHAPYPNAPASSWIWRQVLADDVYTVEVTLEGNLAFRGQIVLGNTLF